MPFTRPTLKTLIERVFADIRARLPGVEPALRRSASGAIGAAMAGLAHGLYDYLAWAARQMLPDTAETDWLERHAALNGLARKPATPATGLVTFTGLDGSEIPAGTLVMGAAGGEYTIDELAAISGGTASVAVTATLAGEAGNLAEGAALTLVSPVTGVQSAALVATGGLTGGTEAETDDWLRYRVLQARARKPEGGNDADYERWTLETPGITRCWVRPRELGLGTVTVYAVADTDAGPTAPDAGVLADAQAHLDDVGPSSCTEMLVAAPQLTPVDFTITIVPDTAALRAAVEAELQALFRRKAEPGLTIYRADLIAAIQSASVTNHVLTAPAADLPASVPAELLSVGAITWS